MNTRRLSGAQGRLHETQGTRSAPVPLARGGGVEALLSASSSSSLSSSSLSSSGRICRHQTLRFMMAPRRAGGNFASGAVTACPAAGISSATRRIRDARVLRRAGQRVVRAPHTTCQHPARGLRVGDQALLPLALACEHTLPLFASRRWRGRVRAAPAHAAPPAHGVQSQERDAVFTGLILQPAWRPPSSARAARRRRNLAHTWGLAPSRSVCLLYRSAPT